MTLARALCRVAVVPLVLVAACTDSTPAAPIQSALSPIALMPIGGGNAMTLPAQRHLVRIGSTLILALQQDSAGAGGLGMFRSDGDGNSFTYLRAVQGDPSPPDTTGLIVVGPDIAVIFLYAGAHLLRSAAPGGFFLI